MEMGAARWVAPPPPPEMPWEAPKAVLSSAGHAGQRGRGLSPALRTPKTAWPCRWAPSLLLTGPFWGALMGTPSR